MQKRLIHIFLTLSVFIYIVFEELVWETIARPVYEYIHALKLLQKVEKAIQNVPAWILLTIFLAIFIVVEVVGVLAGVLAVQGNIIAATLLYLTKIPVAAFAFWLFRISKEKLLSIGWFKSAYTYLMQKITLLKESEIYRSIKLHSARVKHYIRSLKLRYLPRGEFKRRIKRIYVQLKKIVKKDAS